jgi:hypothetical protein
MKILFTGRCRGCNALRACYLFEHLSYLDDVLEATTDFTLKKALIDIVPMIPCTNIKRVLAGKEEIDERS